MGEATTSDNTEPKQASRFWRMRQDDQRSPFITVVGEFATNVALGFAFAAALLVMHLIRRYHHELASTRPAARHREHREAQQPAEEAPGAPVVQPFWASFNRDEAKSFWITLAATVAGAIVSVIIGAIAVIFARWEHRFILGLIVDATGVAILFLVFLVVWLIVSFVAGKSGRPRLAQLSLWFERARIRITLTLLALVTTVLLLSLLGYAVGIK